jgi:hypothetical protein
MRRCQGMTCLPSAPLSRPTGSAADDCGKGFHPGRVAGGALAQDLLADRRNADHVAEEMHHLLGSRQAAEVTVNDNAVKAQGQAFHSSSS